MIDMRTLTVGETITFEDISILISSQVAVSIDSASQKRIAESNDFVKTAPKSKVIYGINTGFGPMATTYIGPNKQQQLQYNLIRSHACGLGSPIDARTVRRMMFIRLHTLAKGYSGVSQSVLETLISFIEHDITPVVPEHGSVGASGDLVQLAHIALSLIGEGNVFYENKVQPTSEVLSKLSITPATLTGRDGLALINGTTAMTAIAAVNVLQLEKLLSHATRAAALLYEIAEVNIESIHSIVSEVRPHPGQTEIAKTLRTLLAQSIRVAAANTRTVPDAVVETSTLQSAPQEIYSLRCVPQILGPVVETVDFSKAKIQTEMNAVTDNPVIKDGHAYHNGNFHGDYLSLEMDKCRIATTKLSILLERQLNFIVNPRQNGILPPFANRGVIGLDLSLQAAQFVATSTTAENQTLSNSMYVHSITTNNDNQDVVSMGTNSALLTAKVVENTFHVQAILHVAIMQAIDVLKISKEIAPELKKAYASIRTVFPVLTEDRYFATQLQDVVDQLKN